MLTGLRLRRRFRVGGNCPVGQVGIAHWTVVLVQVLPDFVEIVNRGSKLSRTPLPFASRYLLTTTVSLLVNPPMFRVMTPV